MTMYSIELETVLTTIRFTLAERVAPAVGSDAAATELAGVVEQLDSLLPRVAWRTEPLARSIAHTEDLALRLGLDASVGAAVEPATLRELRREATAVVRSAYADASQSSEIVAAVLEFSERDVPDQISHGLRSSMPELGPKD